MKCTCGKELVEGAVFSSEKLVQMLCPDKEDGNEHTSYKVFKLGTTHKD